MHALKQVVPAGGGSLRAFLCGSIGRPSLLLPVCARDKKACKLPRLPALRSMGELAGWLARNACLHTARPYMHSRQGRCTPRLSHMHDRRASCRAHVQQQHALTSP